MKKNQPIYSLSQRIALTATMAAFLIVAKLCIAFVPNIEVVTTLVMVFGCVFGYWTIGATMVFCAMDIILYPTTPDVVVAYLIYWNLLAVLAAFLGSRNVRSDIPYLVVSLIMTAFFGVLTSLTQSLMTNVGFVKIYIAGVLFYALHLLSTLVFMSTAFKPLTKVLKKYIASRLGS